MISSAMRVRSVNVGAAAPIAIRRRPTGIGKVPVDGPVVIRDPGGGKGFGSGVEGDFIGDGKHHGGHDQAVYVYAAEDLDHWASQLGRPVEPGWAGENLTTEGIDVNAVEVGERWRVGTEVELVATVPRIPCSTFAAKVGEPRWVKTFTAAVRPGSYFAVARPGTVSAGDPIAVEHRPGHGITIAMAFQALTTRRSLLRQVAAAGPDLPDELRRTVEKYLAG